MWSKWLLGTLSVVPLALSSSASLHGKDWYVAPSASVAGDGSFEAPFASLEAARDSIRQWRQNADTAEPITVLLLSGDYTRTEPFVLRGEDSGTVDAPVVWKSAPGQAICIQGTSDALLAIYDAESIRWEGIEFQGAKHLAIEIAHSTNVELHQCAVHHIEDTGIHLFGGQQCAVVECVVTDCGRNAIRVEAGDRKTLTPAAHRIEGCRIARAGSVTPNISAGIHALGVGQELRQNQISDCPDAAIRLDGNDHVVEANQIARVCLQFTDTGAIYLGHDWTERGNVIQRNIVRDLGGSEKRDVVAIYLDDFASGNRVIGNVISHAGRGIAIGGGEANEVTQNVIEDCLVGIQMDQRGQTWLAHVANDMDSYLHEAWREIEPALEIYRERYPELKGQETPSSVAKQNAIVGNLLQRCGAVAVDPQVNLAEQRIAKNRIGDELFVLHFGPDPELTLLVEVKLSVHPDLMVEFAPRSPSDLPPVRVLRPQMTEQSVAQAP